MTKQTNLAKAQFLSLPLCVWRRGLGKSGSSSKQVAAYQKQQVEWQDKGLKKTKGTFRDVATRVLWIGVMGNWGIGALEKCIIEAV